MKLSVACNFDPELIEGLRGYPVYEVYGKLTSDFFGGGRPSFYLPEIDKKKLEDYVKLTHDAGIEFNYLLNATSMGNREFTREGQRELRKILDWLSEIGVDSITTASLFFLKTIKRRYPHFKVRISSHRYTDNARKVRFWSEEGADTIVISEVNIYREFDALKAMREATDADLSLIVNNSCRQDCAIAGSHAVGLNHASDNSGKSKGYPLDYHMLACMKIRLQDPVNFIRANWIRPEDLDRYEALGYHNFKIVERNTPTKALLERVKAYSERHYDGNLADLVLAWNYSEDKFKKQDRQYFSYRRMLKYFVRPKDINILKFWQMVELGQHQALLYPRRAGTQGIYIDNRALDGFLDKWPKHGCQHRDCEKCRYCHRLAERTVRIDPNYRDKALDQFDRLFEDLHSGSLWESHLATMVKAVRKMLHRHVPVLDSLMGSSDDGPTADETSPTSLRPDLFSVKTPNVLVEATMPSPQPMAGRHLTTAGTPQENVDMP